MSETAYSPGMSEVKSVYKHIVQGMCSKHGPTAVECVHPWPGCTEAELIKRCLLCLAEDNERKERGEREGPAVEARSRTEIS